MTLSSRAATQKCRRGKLGISQSPAGQQCGFLGGFVTVLKVLEGWTEAPDLLWAQGWRDVLSLGPRCHRSSLNPQGSCTGHECKHDSWDESVTREGERECVFRTKLMKAENGNVCNSLEVSSCFSCQKSYNQDHCWVVVHCAVEVPVPLFQTDCCCLFLLMILLCLEHWVTSCFWVGWGIVLT